MRLGDTCWWDASWNPVSGCAPKGPGCRNCYAPKQIATLHQAATIKRTVVPLYDGIVDKVNGRYVFNRVARVLRPGHADWNWPLEWPGAERPLLGAGQPSLIFVVDMGDLFFEGHPTSVIDQVVGTIALSEHIGLLVTRRTDRMAQYFADRSAVTLRLWRPRMWLGFSAERQREFDLRWSDMRPLAAAGWTVFVSIAPMLGPVELPADFLMLGDRAWAICSGEQGPHALCRDLDPTWARAVRDQCKAAGVPFFFKQMARKAPIPPDLFIRREFPRVIGHRR
jgi:protein gp37